MSHCISRGASLKAPIFKALGPPGHPWRGRNSSPHLCDKRIRVPH